MYAKNNHKFWRKIFVTFLIVAILLALACGGLYLWLDSMVKETETLDHATITYSTDPSDATAEKEDPFFSQAEDIFKGENVINILLVGQDKRAGEEDQRSDSMILCTLNKTKKTLTMTSFLRDMWVYIPGFYNQRLNKTYELGGFTLLNETLDYNFGVNADYNVEIDFAGFMESVDLIGGLDVELTKEEAEYLNRRGNWDLEENQHWQLVEGVNHLNGSQTLAYTRIRKLDSDFGRTNRQRKVLATMLEKVKTLGVMDIYNLTKAILPKVTTDLKTPQVLGLIIDVLPVLSDLEVVSQRIPAKGAYSYAKKNGADVIVLSEKDLEKNKALLAEAMKED